jgi:SMODS-associating 2TM, beta-strand rich effector domain
VWKWPIFRGWLVSQPNLNGTWKVLLKSDWIDPETKQQVDPVKCMMTIRQTYSRFSARLFTRESSSYLIAHKIEQQNDEIYQRFGTYQNTPDISLRGKRSEIHYGALVLEIRGEPPKSLVGHYWTDRATKGSLELSDRIPAILIGFQEGAKQFRLAAKFFQTD